jgi:uncharacterized membrane protein
MNRKLFSHPLHPLIVIFPMGLLMTSLVFDVMYLITENMHWARISFWVIAVGVGGAIFVAILGLLDWLALPPLTQMKSIGMWHGLGSAAVALLFGTSWILRRDAPYIVDAIPFILSCIGVCLALGTAWIGGALADMLGVAADTPEQLQPRGTEHTSHHNSLFSQS